MTTSKDSTAIGIDLGTTHCCVAYTNKHGTVEVIANSDGYRTTPSYVVLAQNGIIVGKIAKEEYFTPLENVVYDSKRLIGRNFDDKYIQNDINNWTFKVQDLKNKPVIELSFEKEPVSYKPQEISAMLLDHMKKIAEDYIGRSVEGAVITVPAHFNYHQRAATTEAARLADLKVLGIINEPTAAALAYINKNKIADSTNILVFDLGGGTFDVSIVKVETNSITVAATGGNTHLGGRDFDNNLSELICKNLSHKYGEDILTSKTTKRRISAAAENVKIRLSTVDRVIFDLPSLHNAEDVQIEITREDFENINYDLFCLTMDVVRQCLSDANLQKREIDEIVLVGGSVRIPKIQQMLSEFFECITLNKTINPDEAVAYGAAVQAAKLNQSNKAEVNVNITDVTPLSLGVDVEGGLMSIIIPRNSTIPTSGTATYISVYDKQTLWTWNIYQGERSLANDNIYLGKCSIKLPPKPPGYSVDLTIQVNEDGNLQVSVQDRSGFHKSLTVNYQESDSKTVNDLIQDSEINKPLDERKTLVIGIWSALRDYCTRLIAICDYDRRNMNTEEKDKIKKIAKKAYDWSKNNKVTNGSTEEENAVLYKMKRLYEICDPITKKYDYTLVDISWEEFYKLVTDEQ